jgi:hypothetical protein
VGETIRITSDRPVAFYSRKRLTRGRVAGKVLLGLAGIAALAAFPLAHVDRDPESWLVLGNVAVPATVVGVAWLVVPERTDYTITLTCTDRFSCFAPAPGQ